MLLPLPLIESEVVSQRRMNGNLARVLLPFGIALTDGQLCPHASSIINIGAQQGASLIDSASRVEADAKQRPIAIAGEARLKQSLNLIGSQNLGLPMSVGLHADNA